VEQERIKKEKLKEMKKECKRLKRQLKEKAQQKQKAEAKKAREREKAQAQEEKCRQREERLKQKQTNKEKKCKLQEDAWRQLEKLREVQELKKQEEKDLKKLIGIEKQMAKSRLEEEKKSAKLKRLDERQQKKFQEQNQKKERILYRLSCAIPPKDNQTKSLDILEGSARPSATQSKPGITAEAPTTIEMKEAGTVLMDVTTQEGIADYGQGIAESNTETREKEKFSQPVDARNQEEETSVCVLEEHKQRSMDVNVSLSEEQLFFESPIEGIRRNLDLTFVGSDALFGTGQEKGAVVHSPKAASSTPSELLKGLISLNQLEDALFELNKQIEELQNFCER